METLRDPAKVPHTKITQVIETDAIGVQYGTFRGCLDGKWLPSFPDPMIWQRSGGFARGLRDKGIRSIVVGDLTEEWYLYSIAHPITSSGDIAQNLNRYYPADTVERMINMYKTLPDNATAPEVKRLFGEILSDGQVHLPVRLLARDLHNAGFPVLRYEIRWTPEQMRPEGEYTTC
jgi:carboxylesterase type B